MRALMRRNDTLYAQNAAMTNVLLVVHDDLSNALESLTRAVQAVNDLKTRFAIKKENNAEG